MDWFLYHNGLRLEKVDWIHYLKQESKKWLTLIDFYFNEEKYFWIFLSISFFEQQLKKIQQKQQQQVVVFSISVAQKLSGS